MQKLDERTHLMRPELTLLTGGQPRPPATETPRTEPVVLRPAVAADERPLMRLAALDSARLLAGDKLVAEQGGALVAAISLYDGATIADPFRPTADIVTLLRVRAGRARRGRARGTWPRPSAARRRTARR